MPTPLQLATRSSHLISLCVALLCAAGCNNTAAKPTPASAPKSSFMDATARATAAKAAAQHPAFKVFMQKIDKPVVIVVAEDTTDEQMKNLLWFFRTQIRQEKYKELGLQPTETVFDKPTYSAGRIDVYRGAKCAKEVYITSGPDPCGSTVSHRSVNYHWGDSGDRHSDGGDIITQDGKDILVFNSNDGWQTEEEAQKDPDGKLKQATDARIRYAQTQNIDMVKRSYDTRFYVDEPSDVLNIVSRQFLVEASMNSFLTQLKILELDHMCALHFKAVNLIPRGLAGKSYPLDCSTK
jgi:hypothetical protein